MFPSGFLGTRADVLIDIVTVSFSGILPLLDWIIYVHTIFAVLASLSRVTVPK